MMRKFLWLAAFVAETSFAASVQLPTGVLVVPGTAATGVSFTYSGTLTQNDTIAFAQTGNPCLQASGTAFCTNGAGVRTVAGTDSTAPVGGSWIFAGPSGVIPAGSWTYGALLMTISGVGTVQVFPSNAANGLGSGTPPAGLTLPAATLSALGFPNFSQSNPTITFIVADTGFGDNGGQFELTQPTAAPIPTLSEYGLAGTSLAAALWGLYALRNRRRETPLV